MVVDYKMVDGRKKRFHSPKSKRWKHKKYRSHKNRKAGSVSIDRYYLPKKNLPAHFEQLLFNDSSNFKKIGDQIEALQISELVVQTASL